MKKSKTQILTQLKLLQISTKLTNSICDKTQIMTQLKTVEMVTVVTVVVVTFFSKNNLTPPKLMRFLRAAFRDLAIFFV